MTINNLAKGIVSALLVSSGLLAGTAFANQTTVLNPTQDGSIYVCGDCNEVPDTTAYLMAAGYIQGDVRFSVSDINRPIANAELSVNPYGLPLFGPDIKVYGYTATSGDLMTQDVNEAASVAGADHGTYLGTWVLPQGLGYGQDTQFNVTAFMQSVSSPYVGFDFISNGTDVFSSLNYNYGHPAQLTIDSVPEPVTIELFGAGIGLLCCASLLKKRARSISQ